MNRHRRNSWQVWKIVTVAVVAALAGAVLFWASQAIPPAPGRAAARVPATAPAAPDRTPVSTDTPAPAPGRPDSPATAPGMNLGLMLLLLALISWAVSIIFVGWLAYKLYMRIPAWRRRQLFGRAK